MQKNFQQQFAATMHAHHLKITPARLEVFKILSLAEQPLSPQKIVRMAAAVHASSIYRTLPLFVKYQIARKVPKGFKTFYELGDGFSRHQHYIICENCGKSIKFESPKLELLVEKITKQAGMQPAGHYIELTGLCRRCLKRKKGSSEPESEEP